MVSQAWEGFGGGRVAFGLALVPALAVVNVAPAQTGSPSSSFAAVRDADPAAASRLGRRRGGGPVTHQTRPGTPEGRRQGPGRDARPPGPGTQGAVKSLVG